MASYICHINIGVWLARLFSDHETRAREDSRYCLEWESPGVKTLGKCFSRGGVFPFSFSFVLGENLAAANEQGLCRFATGGFLCSRTDEMDNFAKKKCTIPETYDN